MLRHHLTLTCLSFAMLLTCTIVSAQQTSEIVKLKWINFGPYTNPGQSPGDAIIPEAQIKALLDSLQPYVEGIRTYGTEGGLEKIPQLAKERGFNVMVGIYLGPNSASNNIQIAKGIEIANAGYADYLIVGGEVLYNNFLTPAELIAYIEQVKAACPTIPVTTADVYTDLIAHPEVADACDFIFPNIYPYYAGQPVECALQWFDQAFQSLMPVTDGKQIIISETGWKTAGPIVGDAIPSFANAVSYHRELLTWSQSTGVEVTIFAAFDEPWKIPLNDDGWGLFFSDATLKPDMDSVFTPLLNPVNTWQCNEPPLIGLDTLTLDYIPVTGSFDDIRGHINYLNTCDYSIATYIKVGSGWWTKPTFAMPSVPVLCNGQWVVDYTGGGNDHLATDICFFLVPSTYIPPPCSGCGTIPADIYSNTIANECIQRYNLPNANIEASDEDICQGDSTTLTASGGSQFRWSTGETTAFIKVLPTSTTTYSVTITDGTGGGAIVEMIINVLPQPNFNIAVMPDTIDIGGVSMLSVTGAGSISFLWSTGETTRTIEVSPATTTTYTVTATGGNGCQKVDSITVVVDPVSSITLIKKISGLNVYPVPTDEFLQVEIELTKSMGLSCSLVNSTGSTMLKEKKYFSIGKNQLSIDLSSFPPGFYFLMVETDQGEIRAEKVVLY